MKDGAEARDRVLSKYEDAAFVREGFKVWQENTVFERSFRKKGHFYTTLCDGLRKLDPLRSVVVTSNLWNVDVQETHAGILFCKAQGSGSPLLRNWDLSHARPFSTPGTCRSAKDFHLRSRALAETAVEIRDFSFYEDFYTGGMTLSEFRNPAEISQLTGHGYFACRNLTTFNIKLCVSPQDVFDYTVKLFPYLLSQRQNLNKLCIDIDELRPMEKSLRMQCHDHKIILPCTGMWSYLTDFKLIGATFEGWDFLTFLNIRMPRLRHLKIYDIDFTDWSWDGVFEGLNLGSKELRSISLPRAARHLRHHDGKPYSRGPDWVWDDTEDEDEEIERFFEKMEHYVIHGGRHPNLLSEAPSSKSARYPEPYLTTEDDNEGERKLARYKKAWKIPANLEIGREEKLLALGA